MITRFLNPRGVSYVFHMIIIQEMERGTRQGVSFKRQRLQTAVRRRRLLLMAMVQLMVVVLDDDSSDDDTMRMVFSFVGVAALELRRESRVFAAFERRLAIPECVFTHPVWLTWSDERWMLHTRFTREQFVRVYCSLKLPALATDGNHRVPSFWALVGVCLRLGFPKRWKDIADMLVGPRVPWYSIARCTQALVVYIGRFVTDRLLRGPTSYLSRCSQQRLQAFADATQRAGCPLLRIVGFVDGKMWRTARPSVPNDLAREFYSRKKCFGVNSQCVVTPDGILAHASHVSQGKSVLFHA